jgi:hypothetical protein
MSHTGDGIDDALHGGRDGDDLGNAIGKTLSVVSAEKSK